MPDRQRRPALALVVIVVTFTVAQLVAWGGGQGGAELLGWPATMVCVAAAFAVQWIAFVPAYALQTERFFDLVGSLSFLTVVGLALAAGGITPHGGILASAVAVWAVRLGAFLFLRIRADGGDGRFDAIKPNGPRFLVVWTLQGLWVSLTSAAAVAGITAPAATPGPLAFAGAAVFVVGFVVEVVADAQKRRHRAQHPGRFVDSGLWAWSRHPNYFGEIVLWLGIALVAGEVLRGWAQVAMVSPIFVALLLTRISGVPLLEKRAEERWGDDPDYVAYRDRTPVLVPRPPR